MKSHHKFGGSSPFPAFPDKKWVPPTKEEERKLVEAGRLNDLVTRNLRFAARMALSYKKYGVPMEDLFQEACCAMVRATKTFDPARGYLFVTYAVWWIHAYIKTFIRNQYRAARMCTNQLEIQAHVRSFKTGGLTEDDITEIVAKNVKGKDNRDGAKEHLRAFATFLQTTDIPLDADTGYALANQLHADGTDPAELLEARENDYLVAQADALLDLLPDARYAYVVRMRVFEQKPLREVGEELGVSRERIRQIQNAALEQLRELGQNTEFATAEVCG